MARPKTNRKMAHTGGPQQKKMANLVDDLMEFEEFRNEVLPMLRKDLKAGTPPEELQKKYLALLTAREITVGLTAKPETALVAIKNIKDRAEGKAVERRVTVNKYDTLPDEQLDAALLSEEEELKNLLN